MFGMFVNIAIAGFVFGAIGYVTYCYLTAPRTMLVNSLHPEDPAISRPSTVMDKLAYSTKKSATLFVNLATAVFLGFSTIVMQFSDFIGAPEVRTYVTEHTSPEVGAVAVLVILALSTWARVRNAMR